MAASGQQIVFNSFWTSEVCADAQEADPVANTDITYNWVVSDTAILTNLQQTDLFEVDLPEMVGIIGLDTVFEENRVIGSCAEPGSVNVSCTGFVNGEALPLSSYNNPTIVTVVALNAYPVPVGKLGDTFELQSYWCIARNQTYAEAKKDLGTYHRQYHGFWLGLEDEWRVVSFTDVDGQTFTGREADEAAGQIHRISSTEVEDGTYGNLSSVTPKRAGSYIFECAPSMGNVPAQVTVKADSNDSVDTGQPSGEQPTGSATMAPTTASSTYPATSNTPPATNDKNGAAAVATVRPGINAGSTTGNTTAENTSGERLPKTADSSNNMWLLTSLTIVVGSISIIAAGKCSIGKRKARDD